MKILIIRHGDPDYSIDGLTEKGKKEAEMLAERIAKENVKAVYCSTLGRARLTAQPFLDKLGITAEYKEWLKEFDYEKIKVPYLEKEKLCWDIMPEYINGLEKIYSPTEWKTEEFIKNSGVPSAYDNVCKEFDKVLFHHGYRREKYNYFAENSNHDVLIFVCHFGTTGVILSHILNCSPYTVWQHAFTAPTAVTTIYSEERKDGIVQFRASAIGDVSHLYLNNEAPSFQGRFCECFEDETRH